MKHHTKDKGDLGVAKAYSDLISKGFVVLFPTSEHLPFDLVGYKDGSFYRFQVKARTEKNGSVSIKNGTSWADRNGIHSKEYNLREIDYFCVYNITKDECYYVRAEELQSKTGMTIRVEAPKNNQSQLVNLAEDYRGVV